MKKNVKMIYLAIPKSVLTDGEIVQFQTDLYWVLIWVTWA